jgi:hypothetical protein
LPLNAWQNPSYSGKSSAVLALRWSSYDANPALVAAT